MNKLSVQASQSYGFLTLVDNNAPNTVPALNHQKTVGIDEDFDLSYETNTLQLSLYDRLQWNRYRYDDASYNMHPLYTSNPQLSPSTSFLRVHVLSLLNYQIN